uniref:Uncharacterized protein n=1 Tax=Glossina pallidipes TaxID=7398 RepID=A0A1B0ABT4_GLOPL
MFSIEPIKLLRLSKSFAASSFKGLTVLIYAVLYYCAKKNVRCVELEKAVCTQNVMRYPMILNKVTMENLFVAAFMKCKLEITNVNTLISIEPLRLMRTPINICAKPIWRTRAYCVRPFLKKNVLAVDHRMKSKL